MKALEAIQQAIAAASTLEEVEQLQEQLAEIAEIVSQLQDAADERYEEIEAEVSAREEEEYEAEEAERTGEKLTEYNLEIAKGEAMITKCSKTWEITLLNPFYGQAQYLTLPVSTPESEVNQKCKFYLSEWPFEIKPYCGWYGNQKVEVSAEEILKEGLEAAKQEKLSLLFNN